MCVCGEGGVGLLETVHTYAVDLPNHVLICQSVQGIYIFSSYLICGGLDIEAVQLSAGGEPGKHI